ncbi:Guanine nucleotide-binding protein G(I)/G(S)/G(O) subunit gamma-10, partial [Lemmus lemmus]
RERPAAPGGAAQAGGQRGEDQGLSAAAELQQYCMQNACKDALLIGVPAGSNPFREPRSCALL